MLTIQCCHWTQRKQSSNTYAHACKYDFSVAQMWNRLFMSYWCYNFFSSTINDVILTTFSLKAFYPFHSNALECWAEVLNLNEWFEILCRYITFDDLCKAIFNSIRGANNCFCKWTFSPFCPDRKCARKVGLKSLDKLSIFTKVKFVSLDLESTG